MSHSTTGLHQHKSTLPVKRIPSVSHSTTGPCFISISQHCLSREFLQWATVPLDPASSSQVNTACQENSFSEPQYHWALLHHHKSTLPVKRIPSVSHSTTGPCFISTNQHYLSGEFLQWATVPLGLLHQHKSTLPVKRIPSVSHSTTGPCFISTSQHCLSREFLQWATVPLGFISTSQHCLSREFLQWATGFLHRNIVTAYIYVFKNCV